MRNNIIAIIMCCILSGCNKYSRPDDGTTTALVLLAWCGVVAVYHVVSDIFRK